MRVVIKCKFLAPHSHIYGIMLIVLSDETLTFEELYINLSIYSLDYNALNPDSGVEKYLEILRKKTSVLSFKNIATRIRIALEKSLTILSDEGNSQKYKKRKDIIEIEDFLKSIIRKSAVEREIIIFTALEEVSIENFEELFKNQGVWSALGESYTNDAQDDIKLRIPDSSQALKSSLILSPVGGKPIFDIKVGHSIFVEVEENSNQEEPVKATRSVRLAVVSGLGFRDGVHTFLLSLGDDQYSLVQETENIKVKVVDEETKTKEEVIAKKKIGQRPLTYFFFVLLFAFLLCIFLAAFIWVI